MTTIDEDDPKTIEDLIADRTHNPQRLIDRLLGERVATDEAMTKLALDCDQAFNDQAFNDGYEAGVRAMQKEVGTWATPR